MEENEKKDEMVEQDDKLMKEKEKNNENIYN